MPRCQRTRMKSAHFAVKPATARGARATPSAIPSWSPWSVNCIGVAQRAVSVRCGTFQPSLRARHHERARLAVFSHVYCVDASSASAASVHSRASLRYCARRRVSTVNSVAEHSPRRGAHRASSAPSSRAHNAASVPLSLSSPPAHTTR